MIYAVEENDLNYLKLLFIVQSDNIDVIKGWIAERFGYAGEWRNNKKWECQESEDQVEINPSCLVEIMIRELKDVTFIELA